MIKERVKELRKELHLTLEEFGTKLGVTKQTISRIENGVNNVTEQMKKAICREYGVELLWLETGEGDMFVKIEDDIYSKIDRIMANESDTHKALLKWVASLDDDDLTSIEKLFNKYTKNIHNSDNE